MKRRCFLENGSSLDVGVKVDERYFDENGRFVVLNFFDVQIGEVSELDKTRVIYKTIKKAIDTENPNIIILGGDQAWGVKTKECYRALCNMMDEFEIPYYFILGNHDRENATAEELHQIITESKCGKMEKGPNGLDSFGNYRVDVKNHEGKIVHSIILMDSRVEKAYNDNEIEYVSKEIDGMFYRTHNGRKIYGSDRYDGVRDGQIAWYEKQIISIGGAKSTIITHMPTIEFSYAAEDYLRALKKNEKTDKFQAQGSCWEAVSSAPKSNGLYEKAVELKSTKNVIVGHDHVNDLTLIYRPQDGIRLTYAVKCGDGTYHDIRKNGYTKLVIDKNGDAVIEQKYLNF